jgi:hypothetical protein
VDRWQIEAYRDLMKMLGVVALVCVVGSSAYAAGSQPEDSQPLPSIAAVSTASHIDPRISAAVAQLVGHPIIVRCLSRDDWTKLSGEVLAWVGSNTTGGEYGATGAFTSLDDERISVSPDICNLVAKFAYQHYFPITQARQFDLAQAVAILAHESQHAADHAEEYVAECYGEQLISRLARTLRSSVKAANARLLANMMWRYRYPALPSAYRSSDCVDGGSLDLNRASTIWP